MERSRIRREVQMKILDFGSINIDLVYRVPHIVRPGETLSGSSLSNHAGGKGANQAAALAKAGAEVFLAGKIGMDGSWILEKLEEVGVNTGFVEKSSERTGHAVIQVSDDGENAIVLFGGGNREISGEDAVKVLDRFEEGDILLLQNEISSIPFIMEKAYEKGMKIFFNPAPFDDEILNYPLDTVDVFIVNETEGSGLCGGAEDSETIMDRLVSAYKGKEIILTLGARGVLYGRDSLRISAGVVDVPVVDTTAAGDTFTGYYIEGYVRGLETEKLLSRACAASSLTVTKPGAMESIPFSGEVDDLV